MSSHPPAHRGGHCADVIAVTSAEFDHGRQAESILRTIIDAAVTAHHFDESGNLVVLVSELFELLGRPS